MEIKKNKIHYTGTALEKKIDNPKLNAYIPDPYLIEAVNLALLLKKPLLLMGEPGCGKTRLAEAVAYEFYKQDYKDHYVEWQIKSTTKAQDGLYRYDALRKLYDIQGQKDRKVINNTKLGAKNSYFQRGELSEAFFKSKKDNPSVLLIDEIDKADIDFPNDLLNELDKYDFKVVETGEKIPPPEEKPLIIITSNKEKELPTAFLRRCIYYYIDFPKKEILQEIINANYKNNEEYEKKIKDKAIEAFLYLRAKTEYAEKKLNTSELLEWVQVLLEYHKNEHFKTKVEQWLNEENTENTKKIPFKQVLIKDEKTWNEFKD